MENQIIEENESLGDAVRRMSKAIQSLSSQGLNRRAIIVLLHDCTGLGKRTIEKVLDGLSDLEELYGE